MAERADEQAQKCRACSAAMEPSPNHAGAELGAWFTHPEPMPFGHTSAALIPTGVSS